MLVIDDLSLRVAGRLLLDGASARIPDGARVGLIGRNGIGKTTLFRAIMGEMPLEHGSIAVPARARIGRLAQEAPDGPERLIDVVLAADAGRMRVALAAVLFSEPDLLLLDEPTNYLDLEGTLWLTDHLARYPRTVIVIS